MSDSTYMSSLDLSRYDTSDLSSETKALIVVSTLGNIAIVLLTALRFYSVMYHMGRKLSFTDYHLLGATIFAVTLNGGCIYGAMNGVGQHIWVLFKTYQEQFLAKAASLTVILYGIYALYNLAQMSVKLSILFSYLSFFPRHAHPVFWIFTIAMMVIVVLMAIASFFTLLLECEPVESSWNWGVERHSCIDIQLFFNLTSAINLTLDVVLLAAPLPIFMLINNTRKKILILCALYCVGLIACIASGLRLYYLQGLQSADATYTVSRGLAWTVVEIDIGIICACIPPLKPFTVHVWKMIGNVFLQVIAYVVESNNRMKDSVRAARDDLWHWQNITFWPRMVTRIKFSPNMVLRRVGASVLDLTGHNTGGIQSDWEFEMNTLGVGVSTIDLHSTHESQKQFAAEVV